MKLTINGVSVSLAKTTKEIVFNNGEFTIINNENASSKEDVGGYDIDNLKLVGNFREFEGRETFTGVVVDEW